MTDTIASRVRAARKRRNEALRLRESGMSWSEVGAVLGVSNVRASQLGARATVRAKPRVEWVGTVESWLKSRLEAVEACRAAVGR